MIEKKLSNYPKNSVFILCSFIFILFVIFNETPCALSVLIRRPAQAALLLGLQFQRAVRLNLQFADESIPLEKDLRNRIYALKNRSTPECGVLVDERIFPLK